mgnify:CR=1 FL=1
MNMPKLGLDWSDSFLARDLLTGEAWQWGEHNFVRLSDDGEEPLHILHVRPL